MKKINKKTLGLLLILCSSFIFYGCGEDDYIGPEEFCGSLTGKTIDREIGRVYYHPDVNGYKVYYIGNPDTTLWNGGNVPCNGIPEDFIPNGRIGVLVKYSGEFKSNVQSSHKDPYDPLYGGIDLTFIEKVDEETP